MTTLPNMSLVLPTRGALGSGLWADAIDAALGILDEHDHTPGKGPRVPITGILINDDLSLGSTFGISAAHHVGFSPTANTNAVAVFVGMDNNLYYRNSVGTNVQLTAGNALNVAAFAGGIGGDYTSVAAALNFDQAGVRYTLRGAGGTTWARIASGEVRIFETGTTDAAFVGLAVNAALVSSYTVTWPIALPGADSLMQVQADGDIIFSNTVPGTVAFTNISVSGTLTKSNTDEYSIANALPGSGVTLTLGSPTVLTLGTSTNKSDLPLIVTEGKSITAWSVSLRKTSASGTITARLVRVNSNTSQTTIGGSPSNSANNPGEITLGLDVATGGGAFPLTVTSGVSFHIEVIGGGVTGDTVSRYQVTTT